jgi:hypothetical protein
MRGVYVCGNDQNWQHDKEISFDELSLRLGGPVREDSRLRTRLRIAVLESQQGKVLLKMICNESSKSSAYFVCYVCMYMHAYILFLSAGHSEEGPSSNTHNVFTSVFPSLLRHSDLIGRPLLQWRSRY